MRQVIFLLGVVLVAAGSSSAQTGSTNPLLLAAPFSMDSPGIVSAASATTSTSSTAYSVTSAPVTLGSESTTLTTTTTPTTPSTTSTLATSPEAASGLGASGFGGAAAAKPAADPQYVQGVFVNYSWQAYIGYTYFHFSGPHGISRNMNGFNYGLVYYLNSWFGVEGEMMATHDSPQGQGAWYLFGGGGPRFRWLAPKGVEVFAHGLVGYSHLTPQTAFGGQGAFAYEVGGGADIPTPLRRISLRVGADMEGTQFYNDNQFNPKVYGGVVFEF